MLLGTSALSFKKDRLDSLAGSACRNLLLLFPILIAKVPDLRSIIVLEGCSQLSCCCVEVEMAIWIADKVSREENAGAVDKTQPLNCMPMQSVIAIDI